MRPRAHAPRPGGWLRQPAAPCRLPLSAGFGQLSQVPFRHSPEIGIALTGSHVAGLARSLLRSDALLDQAGNRRRERLTLTRRLAREILDALRQVDRPSSHPQTLHLRMNSAIIPAARPDRGLM